MPSLVVIAFADAQQQEAAVHGFDGIHETHPEPARQFMTWQALLPHHVKLVPVKVGPCTAVKVPRGVSRIHQIAAFVDNLHIVAVS